MVTPDFTRLVAVGMYDVPSIPPGSNPQEAAGVPQASGPGANGGASANKSSSETRIMIYDLSTKQPESYVLDTGMCNDRELIGSSVSVRFAGQYGLKAS